MYTWPGSKDAEEAFFIAPSPILHCRLIALPWNCDVLAPSLYHNGVTPAAARSLELYYALFSSDLRLLCTNLEFFKKSITKLERGALRLSCTFTLVQTREVMFSSIERCPWWNPSNGSCRPLADETWINIIKATIDIGLEHTPSCRTHRQRGMSPKLLKNNYRQTSHCKGQYEGKTRCIWPFTRQCRTRSDVNRAIYYSS